MASTQQLPPSSLDDDCDWEYEYDESQTEAFYVTLDLPLTRPRTRKAPQPDGDSAPSQDGNPDRASTSTNGTGDPKPSTAGPSPDIDPALSGDGPNGEKQSDAASALKEEDKIQILDFHSRNPLISYEGQIYSCAWSTTIGTDVLLTHPSTTISFTPELKLKDVNVLATTGIKLLGTPVQLVPKHNASTKSSTRKAEAAAINNVLEQRERQAEATQQDGDDVPMSDVARGKQPVRLREDETPRPPVFEPLRLPIGPQNGRAKNLQARFLERIANAKARKGDTDKVILSTKQKHTGSGWRHWQGQQGDKGGKGEQRQAGDEDAMNYLEGEARNEDVDEAVAQKQVSGGDDRPQAQDEEMRYEAPIDTDDPEELLFPTKHIEKGKQPVAKEAQQPPAPTEPKNAPTFEASKELYITPAERGVLQREKTSQRGASSTRGRGRARGGRRGRGRGSRSGKVVAVGTREGDHAEDGDVQMGGT